MHCFIKLIAHLSSQPRAHMLIYRNVGYIACAMNTKTEKFIHGYFVFHCWNYKGIITVMGFIMQCMLFGLSRRVSSFLLFSQSWIISAISSLSP